MPFVKFAWEPDPPEEPLFTINLGEIGSFFQGQMKNLPSFPKSSFMFNKRPKMHNKELVLDWVSELGFKEDPFDDKIMLPASDFLAGLEKEKERINLFLVNKYKFGSITGDDGSGKTMLLQWLYEQLQGYGSRLRAYFIDGKEMGTGRNIVDIVLEDVAGVKRKAIDSVEEKIKAIKERLRGKRLVLVIDNLENIPKENFPLIDKLQDLVDVQIVAARSRKSGATLSQKDSLHLRIGNLNFDEMRDMIEKRVDAVGGREAGPFSDKQLSRIYKTAQKNPKVMLKICNRKAVELAVKRMKRPYSADEEPDSRDDRKESGDEERKKGGLYNIKEVKHDAGGEVVIHESRKGSNGKHSDYVIKKVK